MKPRMTPERLQQVARIYDGALTCESGAARVRFVSEACGGDEALRRQVDGLLDQPASVEAFLESPALFVAAELVSHAAATDRGETRLAAGTMLGPYRVSARLGAGGMGEVYRARDTRLERDVAIKLLPRAFKDAPDRVARFEREARVLASLNHPHIGAIYGLEEADAAHALVMELVEGEDLSQRLARGPIPIAEALSIARQIAEALEAAHEQGIIHRDLKPANIKVRRDGTVKVLDFGLAKALAPASDADPAGTPNPTHAGAILGTFAYMSPEQARGEAANPQADIWAFGVVLYELLTGASPFGRPTTAETLARVLGTQPDYAVLPLDTPVNIRHLVRRCLEKDRKRRWQHMGDVRIEVEDAQVALTADAAEAPPAQAAAANGRRRHAAGAIALTALAGITGWWLAHRPAPQTPAAVIRLSIPSVEPLSNLQPFGVGHLAISPDGSRVAYASASRLLIRQMGHKEAIAIDVEAIDPFFSPNGDWVGFFGTGGGGLTKVPALGGTPVLIVATSERPNGGTWRADGTIVFATSAGLYQVSANGGTPRLLAKPDPTRKERAYAWPQFLPDGRSVLFTMVQDEPIEGAQLGVLDVNTLETTIVLKGGSAARYASTGHLVYTSGQTLKAIVFDPVARRIRGDPVSLPDIAVATSPDNGAAEFAVSETGTLLFITPAAPDQNRRRLWWVDRQGKEEPLALAPGRYGYPRISPDGTRVALDIPGANRDIWIWNLQRSSLTQLTSGPTEDLLPVWSRDGTRVFFASDRTGTFDVYSQAADGATIARVEFAGPGAQFPNSFTPDGTRLLVSENFKDLSVLNLARPDRLEPLLHGAFTPTHPQVSPNGNWLAYESDESGKQYEIFLRPFPNVSERREKVSTDGGRFPLWGPKDSGELFYVDLNGNMMAASVKLSPRLSLGGVTKLFEWAKPRRGPGGTPYDISPVDGRFLITHPASEGSGGAVDISVVLNWTEELKRLLPTR
jgi:eukaryotic-like serine/threonine-protein kinase